MHHATHCSFRTPFDHWVVNKTIPNLLNFQYFTQLVWTWSSQRRHVLLDEVTWIIGMVNPQIMKSQCMKEVNIGISNSFEPQKRWKHVPINWLPSFHPQWSIIVLPVSKLNLGDMRPQILLLTIHVTPRKNKKKQFFPIEIHWNKVCNMSPLSITLKWWRA